MTAQISSQTISYVQPMRIARILISHILNSIYIPIPRPRTLLTAFLFLGGASIPVLLALSILPLNFLIGFIGFAMTATGSIMALVFCGEVY
jgi:hypothetical protein